MAVSEVMVPPAPEAPILREFTTRFLEYAKLHVKESSFEFYAGSCCTLAGFPRTRQHTNL